jgi:hypothetical protein
LPPTVTAVGDRREARPAPAAQDRPGPGAGAERPLESSSPESIRPGGGRPGPPLREDSERRAAGRAQDAATLPGPWEEPPEAIVGRLAEVV